MTLQELDVLVRDLVFGKPEQPSIPAAPYSVSMLHSAMILEKLKTPKNRKDWLAIEYREKLWTVGYKTIDAKGVIWRTGYSGTAEQLPEAICLAAVNIYLAHKVHYNLAPEPAKESHA